MKKTLVILLSFVVLFSFASFASAQMHEKSSWYIGFGIGLGGGEIEGKSFNDVNDELASSYNLDVDMGQQITWNFGIGAIINPNFHLGFDYSGITQSSEYSSPSSAETADVRLTIYNFMVAISLYPTGEGFFLKGGVGLCKFMWDVSSSSSNINVSEDYSGKGFLIGAGYDIWLGETFNLGIHAEYSKQKYDDDEGPDDTNFWSLYVSFYWL